MFIFGLQLTCTMVGCEDTAGPDCKNVQRWYPNGKECDDGCTYCADDTPEVLQCYTKQLPFFILLLSIFLP